MATAHWTGDGAAERTIKPLDDLMLELHPLARYYWCDVGPCACHGCANSLESDGYTFADWQQWTTAHPAPPFDSLEWRILEEAWHWRHTLEQRRDAALDDITRTEEYLNATDAAQAALRRMSPKRFPQ